MAEFTVFGASGWIGSALLRWLGSRGHYVQAATRDYWPPPDRSLGNVVFAVGLTADFRNQPLQTADAHVATLLQVLEGYRFDSFLYLSSTRVYRGAGLASEDASLLVNPNDPDDAYNITKLAGESVCLCLNRPSVRVARLSNVIGPGDRSENFLTAVITEAKKRGAVAIQTSPDSEKDYVGLQDVLHLIELIALSGRNRLYNVASGRNVSHREVADLLTRSIGTPVSFAQKGATVIYPQIAIDRIRHEFGVLPAEFKKLFLELVSGDFHAETSL